MLPDLLNDLAVRLAGPISSLTVQAALEKLTSSFSFKRSAIFCIMPGGTAKTAAGVGLTDEEKARRTFPLEGALASVAARGETETLPGTKLFNQTHGRCKDTLLLVPLRQNDEVVGILAAEYDGKNCDSALLAVASALLAPAAAFLRTKSDSAAPTRARPQGFIGNSEIILNVYEQIAHVAQSSTTVLLTGESGTGKELAAHAIHAASTRASGPFISLNCAALPENLVESELFGHEKGAFTGAAAMRRGRFELADGGTLFLDEVGELSPMVQAKLLRVLQDHCFERLGSMQSRRADVRIITATNRDLETMVNEGSFRRDLFYRLNVFPIHLPPLRARQSDILPLAVHFSREFAASNGKHNIRLSLSAGDMLQRYAWPGNVRELANVMERAVLLAEDGGLILPQHLPRALHSKHCQEGGVSTPECSASALGPLQERLDELERACILDALTRFHGHIGHAAEALCLTERIMALRMKKYGITYKSFRRSDN